MVEATRGSINEQAQKEGLKDWAKLVAESQTARRKALADGDVASFARRLFPKDGKPVPYAPRMKNGPEGTEVLSTPAERMRAADELKALGISISRWESSIWVPDFLVFWEDDLGHCRAKVDLARAADGEEMRLASAFSGRPASTRQEADDPQRPLWGDGIQWGQPMGRVTPEERTVLLKMQPNSSPGRSG